MNVDAGVGRQAAAGSLPPLRNYSWPGRHQTTGLTLLQGFLVFRVCLSCLCLMYMVDADCVLSVMMLNGGYLTAWISCLHSAVMNTLKP